MNTKQIFLVSVSLFFLGCRQDRPTVTIRAAVEQQAQTKGPDRLEAEEKRNETKIVAPIAPEIDEKLLFENAIPDALAANNKAQSAQARLVTYYQEPSNYQKVAADVMSWYGKTTNGCVAFMSSALRQSGTNIPKKTMRLGYEVSLVTLAFSAYLQGDLGWSKIENSNDLLPGDIVFTLEEANWPGVPAHTYMFLSWKDKAQSIGNVIDNQGFTHPRDIFKPGANHFTPFAYALRSL